jgi:hypothetical protein
VASADSIVAGSLAVAASTADWMDTVYWVVARIVIVEAISALDLEDTNLVAVLVAEAIVVIALVDSSSFLSSRTAKIHPINRSMLLSMNQRKSNEVKNWLSFGEELRL